MKKYIFVRLLIVLALFLLVLATAMYLIRREEEQHTHEPQLFIENSQPPCVYFGGKLYFVRTPLFEKDVGEPSTWTVEGQIVSSCGRKNIPTQNGEINFDINRLIEPVIYTSVDHILFVHLIENNVSPFLGLVEKK